MAEKFCRWGVLGTATIARKFWQSVRHAENAKLVAVASRSLDKAQSFIDECDSRFSVQEKPVACGSYAELLSMPDLDAVYIPLPTGLRAEWVKAAARQGKHVLCEKPCAVSTAQLDEMVQACETAGVQFMDNVMFMHGQRLDRLKKIVQDSDRFGDVRRISSQFSFRAPAEFFGENIRADSSLEPWGCLGDLGWYNIRIALWAMDEELPTEVVGRFHQQRPGSGPPVEMSGEMYFRENVSASLYCSFVTENQQWVHLSGTNGSVSLDDFSLPWFGARTAIKYNRPQFNLSGYDFNYENREVVEHVDEYSNAHVTAQEVCLVRNFSNVVLSGKRQPFWPESSSRTQAVMDALMESALNGGIPVSVEGRENLAI